MQNQAAKFSFLGWPLLPALLKPDAGQVVACDIYKHTFQVIDKSGIPP